MVCKLKSLPQGQPKCSYQVPGSLTGRLWVWGPWKPSPRALSRDSRHLSCGISLLVGVGAYVTCPQTWRARSPKSLLCLHLDHQLLHGYLPSSQLWAGNQNGEKEKKYRVFPDCTESSETDGKKMRQTTEATEMSYSDTTVAARCKVRGQDSPKAECHLAQSDSFSWTDRVQ